MCWPNHWKSLMIIRTMNWFRFKSHMYWLKIKMDKVKFLIKKFVCEKNISLALADIITCCWLRRVWYCVCLLGDLSIVLGVVFNGYRFQMNEFWYWEWQNIKMETMKWEVVASSPLLEKSGSVSNTGSVIQNPVKKPEQTGFNKKIHANLFWKYFLFILINLFLI